MVSRTESGPHGHAELAPGDEVIAGSYATWTVTYTVGELGLDDGGSILVAFSQTTDMGDPQFGDPTAPNFCRAETGGGVRLDAEYDPSGHVRPMKDAVRVTVRDGSLSPGQEIDLHLGDTSEGSLGMHVQTFPEEDFVFRVLVDPHNTEEFVALPEDLTVDIVPGVATDVATVLPSTAEIGEDVELGVRATDHWGNVATDFEGTVRINAPDGTDATGGLQAPERRSLADGVGTEQAGTTVTLADLTAENPHRVEVEGIDAQLAVRRTGTATETDVTVSFPVGVPSDDVHPYWVRVRQVDGERAWSSPVFVEGD